MSKSSIDPVSVTSESLIRSVIGNDFSLNSVDICLLLRRGGQVDTDTCEVWLCPLSKGDSESSIDGVSKTLAFARPCQTFESHDYWATSFLFLN